LEKYLHKHANEGAAVLGWTAAGIFYGASQEGGASEMVCADRVGVLAGNNGVRAVRPDAVA